MKEQIFIDEIEDIENLQTGDRIILIKKGKRYNEKDLTVEVSDNGCWEVVSHKPDSNGYGQYKKKRTHVLMYEKYVDNIEKGMVVRHECDNPICCNPFHLVIGTQKENNHDKLIRSRLDDRCVNYEKAKAIAEAEGTIMGISKKYNVGCDTVRRIKNNISWKNEFNIVKPKKCIKKLTKEDVIDIYTSSLNGVNIAKKYNISPNTVYDIRKKRIWTIITDEIDKERN